MHNTPWQHFHQELEDMCTRARYANTCSKRALLHGANPEVDKHVMNKALSRVDPAAHTWLQTIMNLGRWMPDKLSTFQDGVGHSQGHVRSIDHQTGEAARRTFEQSFLQPAGSGYFDSRSVVSITSAGSGNSARSSAASCSPFRISISSLSQSIKAGPVLRYACYWSRR